MLEWLFGKKKEEPKPEKEKKKEKPKKTRQEQESEDNWKYEFLVQFLNSPLWRVSILDFVDQKCIIFDSEEENKFEYTVIHNEFKALVGTLFDGMMTEVGLDDDKLVELLERGFQSKQKKLFNQLLLCDDFLKFKDLMLRRNKALEKQALNAMDGGDIRRSSKLEMERGIIRQSMKSEEERNRKIQDEEAQLLRKVLEMSKIQAEERAEIEKLAEKAEQYDDANQQREKRQKEVEEEAKKRQEAKQKQQKSHEVEQLQRKRKIQEKKKQLKAKLAANKNGGKLDPIQGPAKLGDLPPLKNPAKLPVAIQKQQDEQEFSSPIKKVEEVKKQVVPQKQEEEANKNVETLDDRKKRLMEQRQKIRKKKEEERKNMMLDDQPKGIQSIVLQDEGIHDSVYPAKKDVVEDKVSTEEIERRKQIMRKIKNRIVDDF